MLEERKYNGPDWLTITIENETPLCYCARSLDRGHAAAKIILVAEM
jgi:hypothetical protein